MKSLVASIGLLILALLLTVLNATYINKVTNALLEQLEALPEISSPTCVNRAQELEKAWADRMGRMRMTVSYSLLDAVSEQAALLRSCAMRGDVYGYYTARTMLEDALRDLRRTENP